MYMSELLIIVIIKINAFLSAKITQLLMDYPKFASIVLKLILIFQFQPLIRLHAFLLVIMKQFLPFKFKFYQQYFRVNNAIIHVKNALEPLKLSVLNAIHLYMKILNKNNNLPFNVLQKIKFVKILLTFMLELLTTLKIKINVFLNAKISQLLTDCQKFVSIVLILILIF